MGAIASGGVRVVNEQVLERVAAASEAIDAIGAREQQELERRERTYRDGRAPVDVTGRTAILVDDGLATGASMEIVVAVPVAPQSTCAELEREADAVVCACTPEPFTAVGAWYEDFTEVTDDDVRRILSEVDA